MVGKIVLIALQGVAALMGAPLILWLLPAGGELKPMLQAAVIGGIVWAAGLVVAFADEVVALPSWRALAASVAGALVAVALLTIPQVANLIPLTVPGAAIPLAGAIGGYFVRR